MEQKYDRLTHCERVSVCGMQRVHTGELMYVPVDASEGLSYLPNFSGK